MSDRNDQAVGDLDHRGAIHDLVVHFYREIVFDDVLAPVFTEVAEVDWSVHIPRLIDYWCKVLLGEPGHGGAVLAAHREVHDIEPLELQHFDRWYDLWVRCIDSQWAGPLVDRAKLHAERIGGSLTRQLLDTRWTPPGSSRDAFSCLHRLERPNASAGAVANRSRLE